MAKRSLYIKDSQLDDYQIQVINRKSDKSFIVKGCAGSGKSVLAMWKAKQIQDAVLGSYLFIVYTKTLVQYMWDGIQEVGLDNRFITTFNKCFNWRKIDDNDYCRENWRMADADYIIVDEAQDFSEEDLGIIMQHARKALFLYGDSAQQLYSFVRGKKTLSMGDIQYKTRFPMENLVFNHRLPKKIARLAQEINAEGEGLSDRCCNEGSEKPKILRYASRDDEFDNIIKLIKNKGLEDVGILFRNNKEVESAVSYFKRNGLEVESKIGEKMDLNFSTDKPKLMTYHSAKGLQFENVFIPDCSVEGAEERNPLYVAITRTYANLYIMYTDHLSSFFDPVPKDVYDTSLVSEVINF